MNYPYNMSCMNIDALIQDGMDTAISPVGATQQHGLHMDCAKRKIDPDELRNDNLYGLSEAERQQCGIEFLPKPLVEVIGAFSSDPFMGQLPGSELRNEFIKYKPEEWDSYHQSISQWEIERYRHLF